MVGEAVLMRHGPDFIELSSIELDVYACEFSYGYFGPIGSIVVRSKNFSQTHDTWEFVENNIRFAKNTWRHVNG